MTSVTTRRRFFPAAVLIISVFAAVMVRDSASAQSAKNQWTDPPFDTTVISCSRSIGGRVKLFGSTSGPVDRVESAVRRSDGLFWKAAEETWTPEPAWSVGAKLSGGRGRVLWETEMDLPSAAAGRYLLLFRAGDRDGRADATPAGFYVEADDQPPIINKLEVEGPRVARSRDITLAVDVAGAKFMRLAESRAALRRAAKIPYASTAAYRVSAGDGMKRVFGHFTDEAGNTAISRIAGGFVLDTAPPVIKRLSPGADAKSVSVGARIGVQFMDVSDIDPLSIADDAAGTPILSITDKGEPIPSIVTYEAAGKAIILTPAAPLVKGEPYVAHLRPGIKDTAGNEFVEDVTWGFRAVEPSPPETKIISAPSATAAKNTIGLEGLAADPDGVVSTAIIVRNSANLYWDGSASTFTPEPFANEAAVEAKGGLETRWSWDWRLPRSDGEVFTISAAAKDSYLADDPTPAGATVVVDNQEPVVMGMAIKDNAQVTATRIIELTSLVNGATEMRFAETLFELDSRPFLPFRPLYGFKLTEKQGKKVVYGQWRDGHGNATRPGIAAGSTRIILDKTGPKVSSTFPHDQAKNVNISVMLTANFNEISLDGAAINEGTFMLLGPANEPVPANVHFDEVSKSAILTPREFLAYGREYRAVLTGKIRDRLGNAIGHDYGWTFKTVGASNHPPGAPQGLRVVSTEEGDRLRWSAPTATDAGGDFNPPVQGGYNVYRSDEKDGQYDLISKVPLTKSEYTSKDYVRPGLRYYLVRAVDAGGSEGPESKSRANVEIDTFFDLQPGDSRTITPSNNLIRLGLPGLARPAKVRIKTLTEPSQPTSPIRAFEIETSPTIRFTGLSVVTPGDPDGALLYEKKAGSWQPPADVAHDYDPLDRTVAFGRSVLPGRYALVNQRDVTPPPVTPRVKVGITDGKPLITWSGVVDPESGISGYRLYRGRTPISYAGPSAIGTSAVTSASVSLDSSVTTGTRPPVPPLAPTVEASAVFDLPGSAESFVDNNARTGAVYYYGVTAINGSRLAGPLGLSESSVTPPPVFEHRPRVAEAGDCQSCHLQRRIETAVKAIDCRLCHDGTGSDIVIVGYGNSGKNSLCGSCHDLSKTGLDKAGRAGSGRCGGCHDKSLSLGLAVGSDHLGADRLNQLGCGSCHSLHRPGGRRAKYLVDPANTRNTWAGTASDACLACHNAGPWPAAVEALQRFVPLSVVFSGSPQSPLFPGWAKTGWKEAGHSRVSVCVTCHQPHKSPNRRLLALLRKDGTYDYFSGLNAEEALCFECHRPRGPRGAADLLSLARSASSHGGPGEGRHTDTETAAQLGAGGRHVACNDCHNVHDSKGTPRAPFTNKASGALKGVVGVEPGRRAPGAKADFSEVYPAAREYQICYKCHSSYVKEPPLGMTDIATRFNRANQSFHPIEAKAANRGVDPASFVNGWSGGATMYCSDCHSSGQGSDVPRGPHGSKSKPMLAGAYERQSDGGDDRNALCYQCHNEKVYKAGEPGSRFNGAGGHGEHISRNRLGCFDCHATHGSDSTKHLIKVVGVYESSGAVGFSHDSTGGSCMATCHSRPVEAYRYTHKY